MKRIICFILILSFVFSCVGVLPVLAEEKEITVYLNGSQIFFDTPPIIESGRTLVPVRAVFEAMGMTVNWDATTYTVTAQGSDSHISMAIDNVNASVNGQAYILDVPPRIVSGRTLVPIRFIAESLNKEVLWDGENRVINIYPKVQSDDKVRTLTTTYSSVLPGLGDVSYSFNYSDSYFVPGSNSDNGYGYNHDLMRASLALQTASWTPAGELVDISNTSDPSLVQNRMKNILNVYSQMNFGNISQHYYEKSLYDSSDLAAYSFASKKLYDGTTLVAVTIRGAGYGAEWRSDFNVGTGNFHEGFYKPAKNIYANLQEYLLGINYDKSKTKIWLTGYSRSGAIGNILGGMIDDNNLIDRGNLYAYLFAVPSAVNLSVVNAHDAIYNNIKNIVLPHDIIPKFVPEKWNWGRYGKTFTVKNTQPTANDKNVIYFKKLTGNMAEYTVGTQQTEAAGNLVNHLTEIIPSQTKYVSTYQGFVMDITEWSLFRRYYGEDLETFVKTRYSESADLNEAASFFNKNVKPVIMGIDIIAALSTGKTIISGNEKVYNHVYWGSILMYINGMGKDDMLSLLNSFVKEYNLYALILSPSSATQDITGTVAGATTVADAHNSEYYISWMFGYDNPKDIFENYN